MPRPMKKSAANPSTSLYHRPLGGRCQRIATRTCRAFTHSLDPFPEQYVAWHLTNAPVIGPNVTLTKFELLKF